MLKLNKLSMLIIINCPHYSLKLVTKSFLTRVTSKLRNIINPLTIRTADPLRLIELLII
jgi:hypothetical protein